LIAVIAATDGEVGRLQSVREALEEQQITVYFAAVAVGVLVALTLPGAGALEAVINPALALMLFATFLQVPLAELRRAVANLRRTEPLQHPARRRSATALRAAAVAALLLAAGLLRGSAPIGVPIDGSAGGPAVASAVPSTKAPSTKAADARAELALDQMPLVELADPAAGSMIQVMDDEISVVVLMPPLDV